MPVGSIRPLAGAAPAPPTVAGVPDVTVQTSFSTEPLTHLANWQTITSYVRQWSSSRGRSYEYDRTEAGTVQYLLSNRDRRFDPDYASGAYYPNVKPTRRTRVRALWAGVTYPIIQAFTEGFPQDYPAAGMDAVVQQTATDWFYPLTAIKFAPAATTLAVEMATAPNPGTTETITLTSTALPMPQAYPFMVQIGNAPDIERAEVIGPGAAANTWVVRRAQGDTIARTFVAGTQVRSEAVRFAEEQSGTRIGNCLDFLGIGGPDRDIDDGNTLIAESEDLAGQPVLEHLLLIAEAENGRLFAARDGAITFRERHRQFTEELTSSGTFGNGGGSEIPYQAGGVRFAHDDDKLFNHVRITIADGTIVEAEDATSIQDHFRRTLDKQWPLASAVEAQDAADYMLSRLKQTQLRAPAITVTPSTANASTVWPVVLGAEIGQRFTLTADPPIAGAEVTNADVLVERIQHASQPGRWDVRFEFSEADPVLYWRLGVVGASEIGQTTVPAY